MTPAANKREIISALQLIADAGQVVELRALDVSTPGYKVPHVVSGYYNDWSILAHDAEEVAPYAKAVYITPNPVNPALLARASNRARPINGKDPTTSDNDIAARRWLLIDTDPARPAGISATDAEHDAAKARASAIRDWLAARGWPQPIRADSGNGGHLLYRVDLPAKDDGLIDRVLKALSFAFSDSAVMVDTSVHNPARIWKLYGTTARKGDNTPNRPHRLARILETPDSLQVVPRDYLEAVAATLPAEPKPARNVRIEQSQPFDLDGWIAKHGLELRGPESWNGGRKWVFKTCPFNPDHRNGSAYLLQFANGAIAAGCHHNGCQGKDWHTLRDVMEPGWNERRERNSKSTRGANGPASPAMLAEAEEESCAEKGLAYPLTDMGNAERLAAQHGEYLKFVTAWGYCAWNGGRWERDATGAAMRLAKDTVRSIYAEAEHGATEEERAAIAQWAMRSESEARITAMLKLAQWESEIEARPEAFDSDPLLLNCRNGAVDLRNGELRPHDPADKITRITGTLYDASAACPTWLTFLDRIFAGNASLIQFVQRAAGYTLTGDIGEQCLFFCYGTGANGKSTFLETLRAALGDYGQTAEFSTFLAKQGEGVRNDIARMAGTRYIAAIEAGEGRRINEPVIKALTGGDTVTARFLFKEYFEYRPQFKLWLAANHKPTIRGTDNAIWRRIRLVPFTVTIPEGERDGQLPAKLREELPGILAWAVRGCLEWQRLGLGTPAEVKAATEEYRAEMDVLAAFLDECCMVKTTAEVKTSELYPAYKSWAERGGEYVENQRKFGERLAERGLKSGKTTGGTRVWRGIGLLKSESGVSGG